MATDSYTLSTYQTDRLSAFSASVVGIQTDILLLLEMFANVEVLAYIILS